jgi:hypothetical protein
MILPVLLSASLFFTVLTIKISDLQGNISTSFSPDPLFFFGVRFPSMTVSIWTTGLEGQGERGKRAKVLEKEKTGRGKAENPLPA